MGAPDRIEFDNGVWTRPHVRDELGQPGALLWYRENPLDADDGGFYAIVVPYEPAYFGDRDEYLDFDPADEMGVAIVVDNPTDGLVAPAPRYQTMLGDPHVVTYDEPWERVA